MSTPPDYIPRAVREVSARFGDDHPIGLLLRTEPRMRRVWQTLASEGRKRELGNQKDFEDHLDSLPNRYRMETWGAPTDGISLADRACGAFFIAIATIFTVRNRAVTKNDIADEAKRWRTGAALCREAIHSPQWGAPTDRATVDALSLSAAYFDELANFIETATRGSPYVIGRDSHNRAPGGDDAIRGQVRALAKVTEEILGSFLYGTVAIAASVATGESISPKSVENWCSDLPRSPRNKFPS